MELNILTKLQRFLPARVMSNQPEGGEKPAKQQRWEENSRHYPLREGWAGAHVLRYHVDIVWGTLFHTLLAQCSLTHPLHWGWYAMNNHQINTDIPCIHSIFYIFNEAEFTSWAQFFASVLMFLMRHEPSSKQLGKSLMIVCLYMPAQLDYTLSSPLCRSRASQIYFIGQMMDF